MIAPVCDTQKVPIYDKMLFAFKFTPIDDQAQRAKILHFKTNRFNLSKDNELSKITIPAQIVYNGIEFRRHLRNPGNFPLNGGLLVYMLDD